VHGVSYTRDQANPEGWTVVFLIPDGSVRPPRDCTAIPVPHMSYVYSPEPGHSIIMSV
jgi:hypothetical protein